MLLKERQKLKDTDPFTILEYVKTSIEILMNMKSDETKKGDSARKQPSKRGAVVVSDSESILSGGEGPPAAYEAQLVKYEAEVRNHIKIE